MSDFTPNRKSAGKSDGGQFTYKVHGEQDIDILDDDFFLSDDEPAEEYRCEDMHELTRDYMADIEATPTIEGMVAASRKYRAEAVRFEQELKYGDLDIDSYPDPDSWELPENHGLSSMETEDDSFYLTPAILELRAVERINEIRNRELQEKYAKFRGEYPDGVPEIELSTVNEWGKWSGTVQKKDLGRVPGYAVNPGYEKSLAMSRSVGRVITSTNAEASLGDITEALKDAYDNGTGVAYRLKRDRFNFYSGEPEFTEVLIVPSAREVERLELDSKALNDGWL